MRKLAITFVMFLAMASMANAQTVFNSFSRGSNSSFQNMQGDLILLTAGRDVTFVDLFGIEDFTNFAVFDLSELNGSAVDSAYLEYVVPVNGYTSGDLTEEFGVFDYRFSGSALPITGDMNSFAGLSDGIQFGATTVSESDEGSILRLDLNQTGVDEINGSTDGFVTFIGSITTLDSLSNQLISFESNSPADVRLVVETVAVPEPTSGIVLTLVGFGLVLLRRR
ncbi:PEP-CTERM sorting domain-containing protein [Mariniblastus sp.]|nr:PEP-CTERM sorting domain-containing protein [Mariniblastus sp.]